jgi:flagellar biogenesis protein FliO
MVGLLSMSSLTPQNATLRRASMIAFLIVVLCFFVALPYLFRRMTTPVVAIEPPARPWLSRS